MSSEPELRIDGPRQASHCLVLAHGAGAGMDTEFMNDFAAGLAARGVRVVRFEFPYMALRRRTGKRRPPDREPVLRETWSQVVRSLDHERLIVGGKSMGGRIASLIADEVEAAGLLCLGYPFHPVGKPEQLRIAHLREIATPTLVLQGERDPFGRRDEVANYQLSRQVRVHWLGDGDHSFKPRKSSGRTLARNQDEAMDVTVQWLEESLSV